MPRTQSNRSFLNSKEWVDNAIQIAGSKRGGTFESAKRITNHIRLIVQAGCCVASRRTAISSSCRPLTAPPSRCLIAPSGCCAASHCAVVSSSRRAKLSSSHWATLLSSHRAIWLLHFYGTTCRHRRATDKLPPTSQCRAATTATATMLLPPRCHHRTVRRRCSTTAKLPPMLRSHAATTTADAAATATLPPSYVAL